MFHRSNIDSPATGSGSAFAVCFGRFFGCPRINGWPGWRELELRGGWLNKQLNWRGDERMLVLPYPIPPTRKRLNMLTIVIGEPIDHRVEITGEARQAIRGDREAAAAGVLVEEDVVQDCVSSAPVHDVDSPAAVSGDEDCVVDDQVVLRRFGSVDAVEGDAIGVIVVDQVVLKARALHAVGIDARSAAAGVVVNDVLLHQRLGNDPIPAHAGIAVHMNTAAVVSPHGVPANDRAIAAVGDVNSVLGFAAGKSVGFDKQIVGEAAEKSPRAGAINAVAANRDALVVHGSNAGALDELLGIVHRESFDDDVARSLKINSVAGSVGRIDDHILFSAKNDRRVLAPTLGLSKARIGSASNDDRVARCHRIGGMLQRLPRKRSRTLAAVVPGRRDVVRQQQERQAINLNPHERDFNVEVPR